MGAGVRYSREYLNSIGRVDKNPTVGCAVYFGSLPYPRHIGFVYKVTDKMIYTYEGNCYVSSGVSGVKAKSYNRSSSDILDYGHPVYDETPEPDPKEMDGYKVDNTYEVKYDDLQIRKGPGTKYASTGSLNKGDKVTCTKLRHDDAGNTWLQHKSGWSCGLYQGTRYISDIEIQTGWVKKNGKWYYYDENGNMVKNKWELYKGGWYYLGADGAMLTGLQTINNYNYYLYPDGHRASIEWINGLFYDATGQQHYAKKSAWKSDSKGKRYVDSAGWYPSSRTMRIDKTDYEFDKNGYVIVK